MKTELEIVNVVCSGEIPVENGINLEQITEDLDFESKEHGKSGRDIVFENGGMTLYDSGKFIIRANDKEKLHNTEDEFVSALRELGFNFDAEDYNFSINNFVGYGQLNRSLDLNKLTLAFGPAEVSYESEQFSGLMYEGYPIATTFYSNGKVILLGADTEEEIENVFYNMVVEDIKKYSEQIGL